jgi:hypothetical protein
VASPIRCRHSTSNFASRSLAVVIRGSMINDN